MRVLCRALAPRGREASLGLPAQPGFDQVGDLGDDEREDDERPGVDDQRDGAISEARISSIRSETSLWPLRHGAHRERGTV